jgi:hypothetical protein
MSRRYECLFVSTVGDVVTTFGEGNTRRVAERRARRNLPLGEDVKWNLRSMTYLKLQHGSKP